jgi:hypothetical protein
MTSPIFPPHPTDGMVYEVSPGVFFQYSAASHAWLRIFTSDAQRLATSERDGLMSSEDYIKLTNLRIPAPASTLTPVESVTTTVPASATTTTTTITDNMIEGCKTFTTLTTLEPGDKFISIDFSDANIHGATASIDIGIDTDALVQYLQNTGQFRSISEDGATGAQGAQGAPGSDALPVGPYGENGEDGDSIWTGSLVEETVMVRTTGNKAIVNIKTDPRSDTENYLIAERGTVGNPYACPDKILPKDIQSPWLLAIKKAAIDATIDFTSGPVDVNTTSTTTVARCGIGGLSCGNDLFYFNIEAIVNDLSAEWLRQLMIIKNNKELQMIAWLTEMSTLFESQKAALCCALEAINSRKRNQDTRRYIETQAMAAVNANRTMVLTDTPKTELSTAYTLFHLSDSDCDVA